MRHLHNKKFTIFLYLELSVPTIQTHRSIILAADATVTASDVDVHNNTASGFQSSPSNVMNFSIVNGKLHNTTSTNRIAEESKGKKIYIINQCIANI